MEQDRKGLMKKVVDVLLGAPSAHQPGPRMNRKQKRQQQRILRRRAAAANRRKYEGRKS